MTEERVDRNLVRIWTERLHDQRRSRIVNDLAHLKEPSNMTPTARLIVRAIYRELAARELAGVEDWYTEEELRELHGDDCEA